VELRCKRLTQPRIAGALGIAASTVSRVLARAGLSHLRDLDPVELVVRHEHERPGDLMHIDTKSWRASSTSATESRLTGAVGPKVPAGNTCSWPSMTRPPSALLTCTRMSAPQR
jgi:hypothetical protein